MGKKEQKNQKKYVAKIQQKSRIENKTKMKQTVSNERKDKNSE